MTEILFYMKEEEKMKWMRRAGIAALSVLLLLTGTGAGALGGKENTKDLHIEEAFAGTEGTMVLKSLKNDKVYVYNKERSKERLTPESTFKVANALIGLETAAVRDEYEVKRWDGVEREFESWNRDHSLASAMRESAIWFYQDLARTIGEKKMQEYVSNIQYGNQDISGGIDAFWLDSSLKISAAEQADFIEKLVEEELPFSQKNQKTVKRMMIQDEQDQFILHGKTGSRLSDMGLGWYVGFIETEKETWVFSVNIDGTGTEAKNIAVEVLKEKRIMKD
ncbi:class D beta-lactamase [Cytobacillus oceanisediminis]|jgi:beta-lactamase class D|uniref:Beta-lactamase n=3 Tax=Bacillaceae TaxID=186817 RepID=A0ABX3CP34_9BACI|nr:class D beta-lactamase [Cytobacillus oceanisediminis]MBY0154181.1 class D beta-lactamase [Cytobacillus firmus]OHX45536.1 class D beta-lactamase [Cytobacillus oceanisediminis]QOK28893.1 class D beta-lactamase [Cytobacillus oceanisediminis]